MDVRKRVLRAMPGFTERDGGGWLRFDFCNQFLQTEIELEDATADLVRRQFHEDNAWVIEIRFCPILHVHEGLTAQQVVDAACRGFAKGCADCGGIGNPIIGGLIICALRNLSQEHGVAMAELAGKNLGKGVIGWDLAAEEGPHPMSKHMAGFRRALELGVPCTVHAGEVRTSVECSAHSCALIVTVCAVGVWKTNTREPAPVCSGWTRGFCAKHQTCR